MAEEFNHLLCPICGSELVYSEGTHDLGCRNNPKPFDGPSRKRERVLHENAATYKNEDGAKINKTQTEDLSIASEGNKYKSYKLCDNKNYYLEDRLTNVCELGDSVQRCEYQDSENEDPDFCVFGMSFTESAKNGTLWSIRIVDGTTNYAALMRLMQNVEKRVRANESLAANVPNLPKKIERSKVSKLAFRYSLEIEDLYSIKYSTETIERLALFYNLTNKEIRHIKQTDIMGD